MKTKNGREGFISAALFGAILVALFLAGSAAAGTVEIQLEYPRTSFALSGAGEFTDVTLPGCEQLSRPGAPALPVRAEQVVLPEGAVARSASAISLSSVRIPCAILRPFQPPAILGPLGANVAPPEVVPPDPDVYSGTRLYPEDLVVFRGTGRMAGLGVASCEVRPVQYDPAAGEIILHTRIALTIQVEDDPAGLESWDPSREMSRIVTDMAGSGMHMSPNAAAVWERGRAFPLDPDQYQYVIVTEEAQVAPYEAYAAWKTAKGVPATVVTVEWIATAYDGRDLAERIRNFIIDAVDQWGISYVLLGGDEHIVPSRVAWAFDCEANIYPDENDLYADLYYSDLDGTWDDNGNDIFGEVDDNVDLYPDILVGRAPTDDAAQAEAMVAKFLTYEQSAPVDQAMEAFFFAEVLWHDPYTDSGVGKDMIAEAHFEAYEPIERQYESLGNESVSSVLDYLDWGPHLTNHGGHANQYVMGCGNGVIGRDDVDLLSNGPRFFVLYSIGCWTGAMDYDCIGEHFAIDSDGGTVAFVGNARYGWGSPGNPGWGYSETFDRDFYGAILSEGLNQFGAALAWPKVLRVPFSQDGNVYRLHEYQVNLFGDPEMSCHLAEITALNLDAPTAIPLGSTQFTATVSDAHGPVAGARLCLAGDDLYQVGISDALGQVVFEPIVSEPQNLTLTATAASHTYAEANITAAGQDPFLTVVSTFVDDDGVEPSGGNGDGEIGVGETIELFTGVHNYGGSDGIGVTGTLSTSNPHATIVQGQATYGTIEAGGESANAEPFVFALDAQCPPDEAVAFTLLLQDAGSGAWEEPLPLMVVAPGPRFNSYSAVELIGDGDGIVDPGETIALTVIIKNHGSGSVGAIQASLTTDHPDLTVTQGSAATDRVLAPGELGALDPPFEVEVAGGCPSISYGSLDLEMIHDQGTGTDGFLLAIGEPGLEDDMESGSGNWTHSGTNDLWHLTDYRCHSGTYSWYCGTEQHEYINDMNASLVSPSFVVPDGGRFSFWAYFDVTIFGVDGLYVEVMSDEAWETLDYLGSGGALDSMLFVCDWAEYSYDLSDLTPGSTSQIRLRFHSDEEDTGEGFYIDDVVIRPPVTSVVQQLPARGPELLLLPASGNPSRSDMEWSLYLPESGPVSIGLYDTGGRLVRTLWRGSLAEGVHTLRWDGASEWGRPAPSGVYFLRLRHGDEERVRKIVRLGR